MIPLEPKTTETIKKNTYSDNIHDPLSSLLEKSGVLNELSNENNEIDRKLYKQIFIDWLRNINKENDNIPHGRKLRALAEIRSAIDKIFKNVSDIETIQTFKELKDRKNIRSNYLTKLEIIDNKLNTKQANQKSLLSVQTVKILHTADKSNYTRDFYFDDILKNPEKYGIGTRTRSLTQFPDRLNDFKRIITGQITIQDLSDEYYFNDNIERSKQAIRQSNRNLVLALVKKHNELNKEKLINTNPLPKHTNAEESNSIFNMIKYIHENTIEL